MSKLTTTVDETAMKSSRPILCVLLLFPSLLLADVSAEDIIRRAMQQWRGITSHSEMTMTIHRSDWERSMSMVSWTAGDDLSLVRVTAPTRDAGNATLIKDDEMWTYAPRINRIIKIPSSMMGQSWMGSDFSNKDISKSTDIIDQYDHRLLSTGDDDGHQVYVIESIPHESAAVVWGKEITSIRDDYVLLRQEFWDQDGVLVKVMRSDEVRVMGGRTVASRIRMSEVDKPEEWTEMRIDDVRFDIDIGDHVFTLSNLRNPRD